MTKESLVPGEFDAPWKIALELFLEPFLALCFPAVHTLIDWRVAPMFLDSELQQIAPEHAEGPRTADKLVKVQLLDGGEEWLLIHVEVQAQRERDFAQRMWTYYYRIWDKYGQSVVSLAVLADDEVGWHPQFFERKLAGTRLLFEFPSFKVVGFTGATGVFDQTCNPFALLIAAHQIALTTKRDPEARYAERVRLLRILLKRRGERARIRGMLKLIGWLTRLPPELELRSRMELTRFPEAKRVMTIEELKWPWEVAAIEIGQARGESLVHALSHAQGVRESILDALDARFGSVTDDVRQRVLQTTDESLLRRALRLAVTEPSLDAFLSHL